MAIRQVKVSDIDGSEGAEVSVVIRDYPGLDKSKVLDVTAEQAEALNAKAVRNLVTAEIRLPDTSTREVSVTKKDFDAWLVNADEVLKKAAFTRGRRPGSTLNGD